MPQRELLRRAEDELQKLRRMVANTVAFIHDQAYDETARRALAQALGLPEPNQ
ncbi:hypothetical protein [Streptomyces africanus]|uniref:hypothetical protein n=1 Tax=Streptomyces africanus TaxID=231024 RepID=UPI001302DBC7|nr:hypothetical protein [Streptomyces africanus]